MRSIEQINSPHTLGLGISPNEGDIAIVSIDSKGTPGRLNLLTLKDYGYSINDLPKTEQLTFGISHISERNRKSILFVVTVNGGTTSKNLEKNLYNALTEFRDRFRDRKLWIPLMGTGDGGLTFEESYLITVRTINRFQKKYPTETSILLSIPDDLEGKELINRITEPKSIESNKNDAHNFLKRLNCKFYLAETIWDDEDKTQLFLNNGIWENGHKDESYSELTTNIKPDDILIIKSTFYSASKQISYLRIKAFGIVTESIDNGSILSVDWKIKNISLDIEDLGFYTSTIHKASLKDVAIILSRLGQKHWNELLPTVFIKPKKETIAGLISDTDRGTDYLDITKDINAFARVVAAKSFEPPLAIALFGKWGSGKSFFMRKLKDQISKLSANKSDGIYCEGIAHIHFNAWSYMDSNLWASIVTKIFEGLNEYISENSQTSEAKKEIEKHLTTQLSISKEEIEILECKKNAVNEQISSLELKREAINIELNKKIEKTKTDTIWEIIKNATNKFNAKDKILESLKDNDSYIKTEDALKNIVPKNYWDNPDKAYLVIKSRHTFLKEFFKKDKILCNLIWITIFLSIIALTPLLLDTLSIRISKINFLVPEAILSLLFACRAILKRARTVYNQLQPVIASFWEIKESHENLIKKTISIFEHEEKVLKNEIEKDKSKIILIEELIQKANVNKIDLEFRINNAFATEALYSFIDKRSKSEDYKKHLGLISIIRKDFEILNDLFMDHNNEAVEVKNILEFRSKFKKPLERIVLYIDDLDRCPEENVVQVLEAVNLLMAFPLFVVIVGVDSRWVKNALIKKHALQFTGKINDNASIDANVEMIEPSNYLEKIFQIPFHLKDAKDTNVKDMIQKLAQSKAQIKVAVRDSDLITGTVKVNRNSMNSQVKTMNSQPDNSLQTNISDTILIDKPEALILTEQEIEFMQDMSEVIGNNPRAVKRFVNIYRIIKAHEEFNYESDSTNQELVAILFLLALPLGNFKRLLPSIETYIQEENNDLKKLALYLQPVHKVEQLDDLKHQLNVILSEKNSFRVLQETTMYIFKKHNSFIRRFTFKQI